MRQAWGTAASTTLRITYIVMFCHVMHKQRSGNQQTLGSCSLVNTWCWRTVQAHPAGIYCAFCHAGEAFDKVARLLGLDLRPNGGAALEAFARQGDPYRFKFTVPLQRHVDCNFSYAGLKNSVRLAIEAEAPGEATEANLQVSSHKRPLCVVCKASCALSPCSLLSRQPLMVYDRGNKGTNKHLCDEVNKTQRGQLQTSAGKCWPSVCCSYLAVEHKLKLHSPTLVA